MAKAKDANTEASQADLESISQGTTAPADDVGPASAVALDPQLEAIKQGVLDHQRDVSPVVDEEDTAALVAKVEAAKAYEEVQNEIIRKREEAAELQKKTDPAELERLQLEEKLRAAKEYEEYSNSFVVAQNENRTDPVVRDYEVKEAFLSDRETPIEHRLAESNGIEKVANDDAFQSAPSKDEVWAGQKRALEAAETDISQAKDAAKG